MAAVDGEGIRYDIFFTGCPLRCVYCHNPDTWASAGKDHSAEEVFKKIKRFKPYFKNKGGVTFSGGEPLLHAPFINELAPMLKAAEIGYCIDTSGSVPLCAEVKRTVCNADMVILDIKFYDEAAYRKYTCGDFSLPYAMAQYVSEIGKRLWLRTVIVPGINDTEEDIKKYAAYARQFKFEKYELLGFHTMGFFKYERLGIANPLADTKALDPNRLVQLQGLLNRYTDAAAIN